MLHPFAYRCVRVFQFGSWPTTRDCSTPMPAKGWGGGKAATEGRDAGGRTLVAVRVHSSSTQAS